MLICKLKLRKKNDENFSKYFSGRFEVKVALAKKIKIRDFYVSGSYPLIGLHVVKHG